jgi:hypothetical protein
MTQTIEYIVKVNAQDAQRAVAEAEKRFGGMGNAALNVDKAIIALERDIKDLNAAIAAGGPHVEHYKRALKDLQAASVGAVGTSKAGGLLQLSQTVDDLQYGIRGVVNNIPGLVQGFGMGAGVAGAAQLAFIAVNQLTSKITDYIKKQQAATQQAILFRNALLDQRIGVLQQTADLEGEVSRLEAELKGGEAGALASDAARRKSELETRAKNAEDQIQQIRAGVLKSFPGVAQVESNIDRLMTDAQKRRIVELRQTVDAAREEADQVDRQLELRKKIAALQEAIAKKGRKGPEEARDYAVPMEDLAMYGAGFSGPSLLAAILEDTRKKEDAYWDSPEARARFELHLAMIEGEENAIESVRDARRKDRQKAERDAARERVRIEKRANKEIEQAAKSTTDYQISLAADAFGQMTGSLVDYVDAKIKGEEHAEQKAIASFLSATGQQLVASGTRGIMEGAILSSNPLTPGAGAGMIATGAAAIGVGLAMAGGGAALASAVPSGAMSASGATRDPGASPRTTASTGSGGPMIINVSYGAGGPLPEDVAREIHRVVRSGDRRSGR